MRKNALSAIAFAVGAGAIGAFFRWLQDQIAFDSSGLVQKSPLNFTVALIILVAAVWLFFIVNKFKTRRLSPPDAYGEVFYPDTKTVGYVAWAAGILMIFGGVILSVTGTNSSTPVLTAGFAICAILTGICFPLSVANAKDRPESAVNSLLMTVPILLYCIGLINCYKIHATDPSVWTYGIEILANSATLLAFYFLAGFAYKRPSAFNAVYFCLLASFLNLVTIADEENFGHVLILIATNFILLFYVWLMLTHLKPVTEKKAEVPAPAAEEKTESVPSEDKP